MTEAEPGAEPEGEPARSPPATGDSPRPRPPGVSTCTDLGSVHLRNTDPSPNRRRVRTGV